MTWQLTAQLLWWGYFLAAVGALLGGAAAYIAYYAPRCPFCGATMTRSTLRPSQARCLKCGAIKDGGRYVKEG